MRINISVPDDLKASMEAVPSVSWSAVACEAWRTKLFEINAQKDNATMEDVAARLRDSRDRIMASKKSEGKELGREWAKKYAEFDELEALEGLEFGEDMLWSLYCAVRDEDKPSYRDVHDWWEEEVCGPGSRSRNGPSKAMLEGFVDGAMEIWEEVKKSL